MVGPDPVRWVSLIPEGKFGGRHVQEGGMPFEDEVILPQAEELPDAGRGPGTDPSLGPEESALQTP